MRRGYSRQAAELAFQSNESQYKITVISAMSNAKQENTSS